MQVTHLRYPPDTVMIYFDLKDIEFEISLFDLEAVETLFDLEWEKKRRGVANCHGFNIIDAPARISKSQRTDKNFYKTWSFHPILLKFEMDIHQGVSFLPKTILRHRPIPTSPTSLPTYRSNSIRQKCDIFWMHWCRTLKIRMETQYL